MTANAGVRLALVVLHAGFLAAWFMQQWADQLGLMVALYLTAFMAVVLFWLFWSLLNLIWPWEK